MATAVSEHQQNNVQPSDANAKNNNVHVPNAIPNGTETLKSSSDSNPRYIPMSQYIPEGCSESASHASGSSPKESAEGNPTNKTPPLASEHDSIEEAARGPNPHVQLHHSHHSYPGNYTGKMLPLPIRPGGPQPPPAAIFPQQPPQQRFLSGQSISQPSGPTPTLNQLLQTSNTIQRIQNSYGQPGPGSAPQPPPGAPDSIYPQSWQHPPHPGHPGHYPGGSPATSHPPQMFGNPSPPFVHRPPQASTPNTNQPETGDLAGQNSNDSFTGGVGGSGGGAPGTPNSQGMRPSPSPTGSTGSRSMSPAVGQQNIQMPPRPSSSQSDGSGPTRMSHSPMATQGGYQGPPPPPHIPGYKMSGGQTAASAGPPGASPFSGPQHPGGPAPPPHSQFPPGGGQGSYGVRPQGNMQYAPNQVYGTPNNPNQPNPSGNNMNPQYSGRPLPNHFPGYQSQPWNSPGNLNPGAPPLSPNLTGGKGAPVSQPSNVSSVGSPALLHGANSQSPRPPHYLKQHLQHKMGFGAGSNINVVSSHSPPQGYPGMGPPNAGMHHHPGGPMGPPPIGAHMGHNMSMGPPNMTVPNSHDGPMPPPSSTPNSHMPISMGGPNSSDGPGSGDSSSVDNNGITTTAASNVGTHVTPAGNTVTSVVTTGPDGTTLDEGSQQSTLSNASIASGEDPQCSTPKSRKNDLSSSGGHYSHPATPQSTVPSPGAASMNSMHADEYDISSPSWPRTPASPVFNSHVPQAETYRSKKSDSLGKLYEMDDSPDRRGWLDKLLAFMEERRTPITTCPTISKNPLDLFRLYLYVKERGGFMEVTKNKTWKDIAGMLGIGASSSAAYTLRKHYTKNLLAFECKFDRGGIDPQPIINQVEATSKKKGAKSASIPSPGSSNSQDSFPTPGSSGASMDGYSGYGYSGNQQPDYNSPNIQRPSSQANAPSPHPSGTNVLNHQQAGANAGGDNISVSNPFDDGASGQPPRYASGPVPPVPPPGTHQQYGPGGSPRPQSIPQGYTGQTAYNQYTGSGTSPDPYHQNYPNNSNYPQTTRTISSYPPYSPDAERGGGYTGGNMSTSIASGNSNNPVVTGTTASPDPYNRYNMNASGPGGNYQPRQGYGINTNPSTSQPSAQPQPGGYPGQPEYYRTETATYPVGTPGQTSPVTAAQVYGNGKAMPPPSSQPRRHPDFAKDQQYQPYNQQKPQMYGWPNSQYRGQYGNQPQGVPPNAQTGQWPQGGVPPRGGPPPPPAGNQVTTSVSSGSWGPEHRYPPGTGQPAPVVGGNYQSSQPGQPQWNTMPPSPGVVGQNTNLRPNMGARPPFRAEGKPPFSMPPPQVLKSAAPVSGGTLAQPSYTQQPLPKREITFPPDSVEATMPMLYRRKRLSRMDVIPLDAWKLMMCLRSGLLSESTWALDVLNVLLFDDSSVIYFGLAHLPGLLDILLEHFQRSLADMFDTGEATITDRPWYQPPQPKVEEVDLGAVVTPIDPNDHTVILANTPNYSLTTRKGAPVRIVPKDDEIFILDTQKDWDVDGDYNEKQLKNAISTDPWQLYTTGTEELASTKHILTCFQAEFGNVPFVRRIKSKKSRTGGYEEYNGAKENGDVGDEDNTASLHNSIGAISMQSGDRYKRKKGKFTSSAGTLNSDNTDNKNTGDNLVKDNLNNNDCEKTNTKKRTKTLSDVLTRIKHETKDLKENVLSPKDAKIEATSEFSTKTESSTSSSPTSDDTRADSAVSLDEEKKVKTEPDDVDEDAKVDDDDDDVDDDHEDGIDEEVDDARIKKEPIENRPKLNIRDPAGTLKRRRTTDYEDESYSRDESSLYLVTETQESLGRRCICVSNILRNLTFVPGNEIEFAKNATFLGLLGKLLLLNHEHPVRTPQTRNYDREEDADFADSCSSLQSETEWWWDFLIQVRENILVAAANISGYMDLGLYPEEISRPILDGLLHWAICPSAHGQDPFATGGLYSMLSPQRLALESLCKLCVTDANVDLVIATPPYSRLERLCGVLTKLLCRSEEQVLREFAVNLLHYLAAASSEMARTVALQSPCVSLLVAFIEQAEQSALGIANQHGISALRENPDAMGTSLDMLRRAAHTLLHLARHPDNRPLFIQQEQRLLGLVMSQILDQQVASIIARVLFQCSQNPIEPPTTAATSATNSISIPSLSTNS